MVVPATNPAVQPFLFELVTYHVLGQRLYASELKPGTCYNTLYTGLNGGEAEQLCWGESSKYESACKPKWTKKWGSSYSSAGKKSLEYYFVDEQQNTIPLACVDKWVQGGGVIHTVTKVAQPSDLFPSIAVAATKAGLTTLAAAVTEAGLLNTLETAISIVFAPTNTVRTATDSNCCSRSVEQLCCVHKAQTSSSWQPWSLSQADDPLLFVPRTPC